MFATGMMDLNWWKYNALDHRWYRDDDAYADYRSYDTPMIYQRQFIGVHFDGARGHTCVLFVPADGPVSFTPADDPFEIHDSGQFVLKDPDDTVKYKVTKVVCDKQTLTFTMLKISTNEEITVTMGIAPEGFTTDLFDGFTPPLFETNVQANTPPAAPSASTAGPVPSSPWVCPCGCTNNGKYCTECGHARG